MQIEPGKDYETRDGRKASNATKMSNGWWRLKIDGNDAAYYSSGVWCRPDVDIHAPHPLDLVAEWTEPEPHVRDDPAWRGYMAAALPLAIGMLSVSDMGEPEAGIARVAAKIADAAVREGRKR